MSLTKTNIPHTHFVEFQAENTLHRGMMLISYCKTSEEAIEKTKVIIRSYNKNPNSYYFLVR